MENEFILAEIGVKEDDTLVLMQIVQKKNRKTENASTVEKDSTKLETEKNSSKKENPSKENA